jgi:monoamine oxidase
MKTTKLTHILFSLAVIAALVLAAVPVAPAHAMGISPSTQATSLSATSGQASASVAGAVVCHSLHVWRHHHWVTIRVCHRVH